MRKKKERPGFTNSLDEEFTDVPGQDLQEIRHRHGSLVSRDVEEGPTRDMEEQRDCKCGICKA
jgi:hypothetical protein